MAIQERRLSPVSVLSAIVAELPHSQNYLIQVPLADLGRYFCEGGMQLTPDTMAIRTLSNDATANNEQRYDAAVVIALPERKLSVDLVDASSGDWEPNVKVNIPKAIKRACAHAGCDHGAACVLKKAAAKGESMEINREGAPAVRTD
jgi:hypothetical protein